MFLFCDRSFSHAGLARPELCDTENEPNGRAGLKRLAIPRLPKSPSDWDYNGSKYQGPKRAFSIKEATSYRGHVALSGFRPVAMSIGFHMLPRDVREAISLVSANDLGGISMSWIAQTEELES